MLDQDATGSVSNGTFVGSGWGDDTECQSVRALTCQHGRLVPVTWTVTATWIRWSVWAAFVTLKLCFRKTVSVSVMKRWKRKSFEKLFFFFLAEPNLDHRSTIFRLCCFQAWIFKNRNVQREDELRHIHCQQCPSWSLQGTFAGSFSGETFAPKLPNVSFSRLVLFQRKSNEFWVWISRRL